MDTGMCCPKGKCGCQYFILLTLKKKLWTQGSWNFFIKKLILDYYFCLTSGPVFTLASLTKEMIDFYYSPFGRKRAEAYIIIYIFQSSVTYGLNDWFDYYYWVDTSVGVEGITHRHWHVFAPTLTCSIRYKYIFFHQNLQFLNHVIITKAKVLLPWA